MCFLELLHRREGVMVQGVEGDCVWAGCCCLQQQRNPQNSGGLSWPQGRSCVICGCWGAETSLPTSSRCCCPTSSIQSAAAGTESWPGQAGSPLPSPAPCAHLAVPVGGMDQHWLLIPGTARSALSVQLRNVKWLCLIWFALCPEQAFDYLCLTNPLYSNHRAKGALGLWGGQLRKASLYNSRQICFVSMWDCPINLLNILVLQCFLTAHTFG